MYRITSNIQDGTIPGRWLEALALYASPQLSIKKALIPAGSSEQVHLHQKAIQFFFILKGKASFELDGNCFELQQGESLNILPGQIHRVFNWFRMVT